MNFVNYSSFDDLFSSQCPYCSKAFVHSAYLQSHVQRKHSEYLPPSADSETKKQSQRMEHEIEELRERLRMTETQMEEERRLIQSQMTAQRVRIQIRMRNGARRFELSLQSRPKCLGHPFATLQLTFPVHFHLTINIFSPSSCSMLIGTQKTAQREPT